MSKDKATPKPEYVLQGLHLLRITPCEFACCSDDPRATTSNQKHDERYQHTRCTRYKVLVHWPNDSHPRTNAMTNVEGTLRGFGLVLGSLADQCCLGFLCVHTSDVIPNTVKRTGRSRSRHAKHLAVTCCDSTAAAAGGASAAVTSISKNISSRAASANSRARYLPGSARNDKGATQGSDPAQEASGCYSCSYGCSC